MKGYKARNNFIVIDILGSDTGLLHILIFMFRQILVIPLNSGDIFRIFQIKLIKQLFSDGRVFLCDVLSTVPLCLCRTFDRSKDDTG